MKTNKLSFIALTLGLLCNGYAFSMQHINEFARKNAQGIHMTTQDVLNAAIATKNHPTHRKYIHNKLLEKIKEKIEAASNSIITYSGFLEQEGINRKQIIQAIQNFRTEFDSLKNAKRILKKVMGIKEKRVVPKKVYKEVIEANELDRLRGRLSRRMGSLIELRKENSPMVKFLEQEVEEIQKDIKKLEEQRKVEAQRQIKIKPLIIEEEEEGEEIEKEKPKYPTKPFFTDIWEKVKIPRGYKLTPQKSTPDWYSITPEKGFDTEALIKQPKVAEFRRGHVKDWFVPIFTRDERFEMIHFDKLPDIGWRREDLKKVPRAGDEREIRRFAKEMMEGQAYNYKIHLQIKPKYIAEVADRLANLIAQNQNIFPEVYFKVAGQIVPGENYFGPRGEIPAQATPIFVIYIPYLPSSMSTKEKEAILIPMIETIKNEFKNEEDKIELKIAPRFNMQVYKYIYVSGGEGRDKVLYRQWLNKNRQANKIYTDDLVFYKGYEIFKKFKKEKIQKHLKKFEDHDLIRKIKNKLKTLNYAEKIKNEELAQVTKKRISEILESLPKTIPENPEYDFIIKAVRLKLAAMDKWKEALKLLGSNPEAARKAIVEFMEQLEEIDPTGILPRTIAERTSWSELTDYAGRTYETFKTYYWGWIKTVFGPEIFGGVEKYLDDKAIFTEMKKQYMKSKIPLMKAKTKRMREERAEQARRDLRERVRDLREMATPPAGRFKVKIPGKKEIKAQKILFEKQ